MNKTKYIVSAVGILVVLLLVYFGVKNKIWEKDYVKYDFAMIDRGNYGLYGQKVAEDNQNAANFVTYVIDNQADWKSFWEEYIRSANTGGFAKEPDVDFEKKVVVAMLQGVKQSGGYFIQTDKVETAGDNMKISLNVVEPTESQMNTQVVSSPYEIIQVDKNNLIQGGGKLMVVNINNGQIVLEKKISELLFKR